MNDLASPPRSWDEAREPESRTLFVINHPDDNPTESGWESEPY